MKIIGVDLRCLPVDGSAGAGVAHAAKFVVQEMVKLSVAWQWRLYVPKGALVPQEGYAELIELPNQSGQALRTALKKFPCDSLFVPGGSVAPGISIPQIPWVHDVAIFSHPEWFPQSWMKRKLTTYLFQRGLKRAPLIFSVSEATKSELVNNFKLDAQKIIVTYEGGDNHLSQLNGSALEAAKHSARLNLQARGILKPFILVLGTVEPRKNVTMLIEAWHQAKMHGACELIVAGRDGWKVKDIKTGQGLRRLKNVDDELRRELLLAAEVVALPSNFEGFGLVALETMQAGAALIASKSGAIPEITGSEIALLDPTDQASWSAAIDRLMSDKQKRDHVALVGKTRSHIFSWPQTAKIISESLKVI